MINNFLLKFGKSPSSAAERITTSPITVFVGPNNSGKSRVLSEIEQYCRSGTKDSNALILEDLTFMGLSNDETDRAVEHLRQAPNKNETVSTNHILIGSKYGRQQVDLGELKSFIQNPTANLAAFCRWFLTHNTLILDGRNRINLINQQSAGDLQQPAQTSFQVLFKDDIKRTEVRRIIAEAFNLYFVLDPTNLGQLRIRLSKQPPVNDMTEKGVHTEAVMFHSQATLIDDTSDGVKAFTGIITEVIAGDPKVLLIDEPEAFLHPSLASKLGMEISKAAKSADKRVFVSTHSTSFVMGCIHSGVPVNIIRLTHRDDVSTARSLPSSEILELMRNPLLRSTGLLSGLFYEFVIVTESDADRAFYQEINERLLRFKPEWGIPNCLFINAQNKQTIRTLIEPLRKLGIPAAAILDIDTLKDGGNTWSNLLTSAGVPDISLTPLAASRAAIKNALIATGMDMKTDGGISILDTQNHEAASNLLNQLKEYGLFIIPNGELESWLQHLGIPQSNHGPTWLIKIFEKMGEDYDSSSYVKPSETDVWQFMSELKNWLLNPNRKGIPS